MCLKYYRITQHYIKHLTVSNLVKWVKVPGTELYVDMLTKPLPYPIMTQHRNKLIGFQGMRDVNTIAYIGSEYSSSTLGDGPIGQSVHSAKEDTAHAREINNSLSQHKPAFVAYCDQCRHYQPWVNGKWVDCVNCDVVRTCVYCRGCFNCVTRNKNEIDCSTKCNYCT